MYGNYFEGDILVDRNSSRFFPLLFGNSLEDKSRKWQNRTVPYLLSSNHTESENQLIETVLREFESISCLRFIPRTNQTDYVQVTVSKFECFYGILNE